MGIFDYIETKIDLLPLKLSETWEKAVKYGWYPSPTMPGKLRNATLGSQETIDARMLSKFQQSYDKTKSFIVSKANLRTHIIEVALKLHEEKNYIASIPLLLAQSDGVFEELIGESVFSRRQDKQRKIKAFIDKSFGGCAISYAFFDNFGETTQFHENSNKCAEEDKSIAPNRNGILHGDAKHLDYGTYSNSCKSINLITSVLWLVDAYRENQT